MYPIQAHEVRAIWQAEALRTAQEVKMANAVKVGRSQRVPALLTRFIPALRKQSDCAQATSYAPSPC
jgi:hypothetical protein